MSMSISTLYSRSPFTIRTRGKPERMLLLSLHKNNNFLSFADQLSADRNLYSGMLLHISTASSYKSFSEFTDGGWSKKTSAFSPL